MVDPVAVKFCRNDDSKVSEITWQSRGSFGGSFPPADAEWDYAEVRTNDLPIGRIRRELIDLQKSAIDQQVGLVVSVGVPYFTKSASIENQRRLVVSLIIPNAAASPTWTVSFVPKKLDETLFPYFFKIFSYGWPGVQTKVLADIAFSSTIDAFVSGRYGAHPTDDPDLAGRQSTTQLRLKDAAPTLHVASALDDAPGSTRRHNIGLLSLATTKSDQRALCIVFVPYANDGTTTGKFVDLHGLDSWEIDRKGHDPSVYSVLYFPLGDELTGAADWRPTWHSLLQAPPLGAPTPSAHIVAKVSDGSSRSPVHMLLWAWNQAATRLYDGKISHAGRPFSPLPSITYDDHDSKRQEVVPLFQFASSALSSGSLVYEGPLPWAQTPELSRIHLRSVEDARGVFTLHFQLFGRPATVSSAQGDDDLTVEGKLLLSSVAGDAAITAAWIPSIDNSGTAIAVRRTDQKASIESGFQALFSSASTADDVLAEFRVEPTKVTSKAGTEWLRIGALEFKFDSKPASNERVFITCRLRGTWNRAKCDVFPEIEMHLPCAVRHAPTDDPPESEITATLDVRDPLEDRLQRESSAIIESGDEIPLQGAILQLRMLTRPGQNPVTEMLVTGTPIQSEAKSPERFYFCARPFIVAMLGVPKIDAEALDRFATWRSDDTDYPQWRIGSSEVEFRFPPQAVGEEMERGIRFWKSAADADMNGKRLARYRYARPTHVAVRPSLVERRYNASAANLREVLRIADVERFTTEMVYPLEIEFKRDNQRLPDVRIAEAGEYFGMPAANLPPLPGNNASLADSTTWPATLTLFSGTIAHWLEELRGSSANAITPVREALHRARETQAGNRATFVSRLGVFRLFDPYRRDRGLSLETGLKFTIRDRDRGAAPLAKPLPRRDPDTLKDVSVDLAPVQKTSLARFLEKDDWVEQDVQGAIAGGLAHTFEFPSELHAVLRAPVSKSGRIDSLALSALGATGAMEAAFDEGRTIFAASMSYGQLSRLVKTRIGRIGVAWNVAKHVIVYERTTVPSRQFAQQQARAPTGWPTLHKTEEYVDVIEPRRAFDSEAQGGDNRCGAIAASVFVTRRIYVDGAWGRDLGHGYEIPLWNPAADQSLYPKPTHLLEAFATGDTRARLVHDHPEDLHFYSNTEPGTGADTNAWTQKIHVDFSNLPRMGLFGRATDGDRDDIIDGKIRSPGLDSPFPGRFNFRVRAEGQLDLQHARGDTPMLARVDQVYLSRSSQRSRVESESLTPAQAAVFAKVQKLREDLPTPSALIPQLRKRLEDMITDAVRTPALAIDCKKVIGDLKVALGKERDAAVAGGLAKLASVDAFIGKDAVPAELRRIHADLVDLCRQPRAQIAAYIDLWRIQLAEGKRYKEAHGALADSVRNIKSKVNEAFASPKGLLASASGTLQLAAAQVRTIDLAAVKNALASGVPSQVTVACDGALRSVEEARGKLRTITDPKIAAHLGRLDSALALIAELLDRAKALYANLSGTLQTALATAVDGAVKLIAATAAVLDALRTGLDALQADVNGIADQGKAKIEELLTACEAWQEGAIDNLLGAGGAAGALLRAYDDALGRIDKALGDMESTAAKPFEELGAEAKAVIAEGATFATKALDDVFNVAYTVLDNLLLNCTDAQQKLNDMSTALQKQVAEWASEGQQRLEKAVTDLTGSEFARQLDDVVKQGGVVFDKGDKALKLARAVGELPELPHLTFSVDRAEYLFDDVKKQIETSPFAAKLRDIDSGLKELGLAVPSQELLDQVVPMSLKNLDSEKIFKSLGGLKLAKDILNFPLPQITGDELSVTHGVDRQTRSAWVKAKIDKHFDGDTKVLDIGPLKISVAGMQFFAQSDIQTALDGTRRATTLGRIKGDWKLAFGGQDLVTFRAVAIQYEGDAGFSFDVSPDRVELHPSLKFISDFANAFGEKVPPNIQLLRDGNGKPTGVSASFLTPVPQLPPMGTFKIGPFDIASGLGLRIEPGGAFVVSSHFSLGTRAKPVFVEVNKLGGGFFIETEIQYPSGGSPRLRANLGLTLGSQESFTLGGVARGSYALLFFAYISVTGTDGTSFVVGVLISGSARILGIASASVTLLLEVRQDSGKGGGVKGRGSLDVEIEICWCFTLRVHQQVERTL